MAPSPLWTKVLVWTVGGPALTKLGARTEYGLSSASPTQTGLSSSHVLSNGLDTTVIKARDPSVNHPHPPTPHCCSKAGQWVSGQIPSSLPPALSRPFLCPCAYFLAFLLALSQALCSALFTHHLANSSAPLRGGLTSVPILHTWQVYSKR